MSNSVTMIGPSVYQLWVPDTMELRKVGAAIAVPVGCFSEPDWASLCPRARSHRQDSRDDLSFGLTPRATPLEKPKSNRLNTAIHNRGAQAVLEAL
jgi:hypothetical protein